MGVKNISDLFKGTPINLNELSQKKLAVDAYNIIYQFLASIRGYDGSLLADKEGVASQDYDSILFGSPILVRNLTLSGRRKLPHSNRYININVETYNQKELLKTLNLSREQLVDMSILIGTDFNPDGIKGIGPKTAYKYITKHGNLEMVVENEEIVIDADYEAIRDIFLNPVISDEYNIKFKSLDIEGVVDFLCNERGFSKDRVENTLKKAKRGQDTSLRQKRLDAFFG